MNNKRLTTLLYNSIILLEEQGYEKEQIKEEIGITDEEYNQIVDDYIDKSI